MSIFSFCEDLCLLLLGIREHYQLWTMLNHNQGLGSPEDSGILKVGYTFRMANPFLQPDSEAFWSPSLL